MAVEVPAVMDWIPRVIVGVRFVTGVVLSVAGGAQGKTDRTQAAKHR